MKLETRVEIIVEGGKTLYNVFKKNKLILEKINVDQLNTFFKLLEDSVYTDSVIKEVLDLVNDNLDGKNDKVHSIPIVDDDGKTIYVFFGFLADGSQFTCNTKKQRIVTIKDGKRKEILIK